jgi:hypothetical protein
MKRLLIFLIILLPGLLAAQTVKRNTGESESDFAKRIQPKSCKVQSPVLHGKYNFLTDKEELIVFFDDTITQETYAQLYLPTDSAGAYRKISIDTLFPGLFDNPIIISVFFDNVDKDAEKEMIVLYSIGTRYPSGDTYAYTQHSMISVYDNATDSHSNLKKLPDPAGKLDAAWNTKYKQKAYNAADMRKLIKKEKF